MADDAMRGEVTTRLIDLVLKYIFIDELGGQLDEIVRLASEVFQQPSGMEMVIALLRYLSRSAVKLDKGKITQKLLQHLPKEGGVLMQTLAQEWIEEGKLLGIDIGKQVGIDIGKQQGKQEGIDIGKQVGIDIGKQVGIDIGKQVGIDIGIEEANRRMIHAMAANQFTIADIARIIGFSVEEVERLLHKQETPLATLPVTKDLPIAQAQTVDNTVVSENKPPAATPPESVQPPPHSQTKAKTRRVRQRRK
jgi:hypothetical protein